jgi:hypothetical protein
LAQLHGDTNQTNQIMICEELPTDNGTADSSSPCYSLIQVSVLPLHWRRRQAPLPLRENGGCCRSIDVRATARSRIESERASSVDWPQLRCHRDFWRGFWPASRPRLDRRGGGAKKGSRRMDDAPAHGDSIWICGKIISSRILYRPFGLLACSSYP